MRRLCGFLAFLAVTGWSVEAHPAEESVQAQRPIVVQIELDDEAITPTTVRFVQRAIKAAEQDRAECLVIVLDTPGGLVASTRTIVKDIIRSPVPVVVYVAPPGGRAASAGVFVTLASHVAAMAPGTNIGAAHPVQIGGLPSAPPPGDPRDDETPRVAPAAEKAVNDTVAWARTLAELRGRNAEWAALAVKESLSISATEALEQQVVEVLADDVDDLLAKIHGREALLADRTVRLNTAGAEIRSLQMWWGERFLAAIANPNVALLLLVFGFYGILFEFYSPGWGVAGTLGAICLVLAFFSLAVLPVNYVGLALILLALSMFVAEAFVVSYGFLTLGGMICLVLGGLMLVESPVGFQRVSLAMLIPVALATGGIAFFLVGAIVQSHRRKVRTGSEAMAGKTAHAAEDFVLDAGAYTGRVRVHGELWNAECPSPTAKGQPLIVQQRRGMLLLVEPAGTGDELPSKNRPSRREAPDSARR